MSVRFESFEPSPSPHPCLLPPKAGVSLFLDWASRRACPGGINPPARYTNRENDLTRTVRRPLFPLDPLQFLFRQQRQVEAVRPVAVGDLQQNAVGTLFQLHLDRVLLRRGGAMLAVGVDQLAVHP